MKYFFMTKNLTNSYRDRQNIINNSYLLKKVEDHFNLHSMKFPDKFVFEGNLVFTKQQL